MDADVNLNAIIFGESIFNDAIGIVMYQTVIEAGQSDSTVRDEFMAAAGRFLLIFIGSLLIGAVSALLIAFIMKRQSSYIKEA